MENLFLKNRQTLYRSLEKNSLVFLYASEKKWRNGDVFFPYRQNSNFFYLTGIEQFSSILLLYKSEKDEIREFLFLYQPLEKEIIYDNSFLSAEDAQTISGIDTVQPIDHFERHWKDLMDKDPVVYIPPLSSPFEHHLFLRGTYELLKKRYPTTTIKDCIPLIEKQRLVKNEQELQFIQQAISYTKEALLQSVELLKKGTTERQLASFLLFQYQQHAHTSYAFDAIVAGGKNACVLHYSQLNDSLSSSDLVLIDTGAEYFNYAGDITRVFPVNGTFSSQQKKIYQAVLSIQEKAIDLFVPGTTINAINKTVNQWMFDMLIALNLIPADTPFSAEVLKTYYPHGVTHFMGLDVHDVGTKDTPLEPGMVLTCEPGLYIKDLGIGIRIEDDVLVTTGKPEVLSKDIPKQIDEIESLFR